MDLYTHSTGYHAPAVTIEPTFWIEELFLILYCIVDDPYPEVAPDWVRFRRSADQMGLSDSAVITLSIMQEGRSRGGGVGAKRLARANERNSRATTTLKLRRSTCVLHVDCMRTCNEMSVMKTVCGNVQTQFFGIDRPELWRT